jgi:hypothetical protein
VKIIDNDGKEISIEDVKRVVINCEDNLFIRMDSKTYENNMNYIADWTRDIQNVLGVSSIVVLTNPEVKIYKGEKII